MDTDEPRRATQEQAYVFWGDYVKVCAILTSLSPAPLNAIATIVLCGRCCISETGMPSPCYLVSQLHVDFNP